LKRIEQQKLFKEEPMIDVAAAPIEDELALEAELDPV